MDLVKSFSCYYHLLFLALLINLNCYVINFGINTIQALPSEISTSAAGQSSAQARPKLMQNSEHGSLSNITTSTRSKSVSLDTTDQTKPANIRGKSDVALKLATQKKSNEGIIITVTLAEPGNDGEGSKRHDVSLRQNETIAELIENITSIIAGSTNDKAKAVSVDKKESMNSKSDTSGRQKESGSVKNQQRSATTSLPDYNQESPASDYNDQTYHDGSTSAEEDCICVPYYQCDSNNQIVTDGSGILDPRSLVPSDNSSEIPQIYNRQLKTSSITTNNNKTIRHASSVPGVTVKNLSRPKRAQGCGRYQVCCHDPEASVKKHEAHKHDHLSNSDSNGQYQPKCGRRNHVGVSTRILAPTGNHESHFGEYPWMAAIIRHENGSNVFVCGASLINRRYVLTVGHCVQPYFDGTKGAVPETDSSDPDLDSFDNAKPEAQRAQLRVRLSEWDTQKTDELFPHEDYDVIDVIIHPEFQTRNLWNDIALLKLDRPVQLRPGIDTICLPTQSLANISDGRPCFATGWGKDAYRSGQHSNILKEVELQIVPVKECETALRQTRLGSRFKLHSTFLCGGGKPESDTCTGDGGGPLVCARPSAVQIDMQATNLSQDPTDYDQYELAGIVSWGVSCGLKDIPGAYTDVGQYLEWIQSVIGNQEIDNGSVLTVHSPVNPVTSAKSLNNSPS